MKFDCNDLIIARRVVSSGAYAIDSVRNLRALSKSPAHSCSNVGTPFASGYAVEEDRPRYLTF